MPSVRITVGAQADASFTRVFAPLLEASTRARVVVTRNAQDAGKAQAKAAQQAARVQEREFTRAAARGQAAYQAIQAAAARAAAREAAEAQKAAQAKVRADQRAFDQKLKLLEQARAKEHKDAARAQAIAAAQQQKQAERAQANLQRLAQQAERESIKMQQREQARKERAARDMERADRRAFDQRLRESKRAREREEREILRDVRAAERREARQAASQAAGEQKTRAQRLREIGKASLQNIASVGRAGFNLGKDALQAAGVRFDLPTLMQRGIELETTATDVTTSAFAAKGQRAGRADVLGTISAIRTAGDVSAQSYNAMAEGLSDFVSKSADLETGKKILGDLGLIARATGTEVGALISAAGDVGKTLEDTPDKAERLLAIMRLVAKQGAMGNVEIKDLATYMGNITASAFMYEGGIDKNIGILGGLAQIAMKGGATSAAEGTRAAAAFGRDVTKGRALERFQDAGIEIFADEAKTQLVSPEKLITQFLQKTGGNLEQLAELFQNDMSKKIIKGYSSIYQAAGGGEAGILAVQKTFRDFSTGMSAADVQAAANLSKGSTAGRAHAFQNRLETLGAQLGDKLLPAVEKLEPHILKLAEAFTKSVSWAAENPGKAITLAIVGSIAKAAIGNAISTALSGAVSDAAAGGGGAIANVLGKVASGKTGATVGAGLAAATSIGAAIYMGKQVHDNWREGLGGEMWDRFGRYGMTSVVDAFTGDNSFAAVEAGAATGVGSRFASAALAARSAAGFAPPPVAGAQPAGAPPTVTAPPPNPVPTLQEISASQKQATAALQTIAKNTAGGMAPPGVDNRGRTGPGA